MRKGQGARGKVVLFSGLILLLLAGCQREPIAQAAVTSLATATAVLPTQPVNNPTIQPTILPTIPPPATPTPLTVATAPASFSPLSPEELAQNQAALALATDAATATPTDTPTPTHTPQPTFTPPALPNTSPNEHYWLRRPIPEGGTVWTDKSYPYGGTKGGTLRPHHGVEFYVPTGTEVIAAASGTVVFAGRDDVTAVANAPNFYGNVIIIELDSQWQGQPVYNLYGHLSEILVIEGQIVESQELIALSGATGVADGPHLHFEVRVGENSYSDTRNPLLWLYPFPDYGTVAGRVTWPNGQLVEAAPVSLRRIDADSRYLATTTYTGTDINPDDTWQENFALDDVPAGYYEITVNDGRKKYTEEVWVFPYRTAFVEITLDATNIQLND